MADAKTVLAIASRALTAFEVVGAAVDAVIGKNPTLEEALAVLGGVSKVAAAIRAGLDGTASHVDVAQEIGRLQASIASNNQAIDAEINDKFPQG